MVACGSDDDNFRIEGTFRNMNLAQFYIFDSQKGTKDTIQVQRGRFRYEQPALLDTTTLILMFPNYSTLPIFAYPGITVKLNGDASQLKATEVKGSEENEDMTAFRLKANQLTPPEIREEAVTYIKEHPTSPVSFYLLQNYFIQSVDPDYVEASRLCSFMLKVNPNQPPLLLLYAKLRELRSGAVGSRLPRFAVLDANRKVRTNADLSKKINIVILFSSWNYKSTELMRQAQRLQRAHPADIALMGINIDATRQESRVFIKNDTITCPIIFTGDMWQTPLAQKMGLVSMPSNLIADRQGKILKRDITEAPTLRAEIERLLQ